MSKPYKNDKNKPLAAIPFQDFPFAIEQIVGVCTHGEKNHGRSTWKLLDNVEERLTDALARHFLASFVEATDPESGIDHLAHLAWNCLALMELRKDKEND